MTLNLIHVPIDLRRFNMWLGQRDLIRRGQIDLGFGLHIYLSSIFGPKAIQPFRLFANERRRNGSLYGYTEFDSDVLRERWEEFAPPDCLEVVSIKSLRSKIMPTQFEIGRTVGFDIRIRPVRRIRQELVDHTHGLSYAPYSELDAYIQHRLRREQSGKAKLEETDTRDTTRDEVYRVWLDERLGEAAKLRDFRLTEFQRTRVNRGRGRLVEGPDVTAVGTLEVQDETAFEKVISNGVGRHKSYGYGMMLLRPPRG